MKITVNRESLLKALDITSNALGGKVLFDAYNYLLFNVKGNKCYIHGRNEQTEIKAFLNVKAKGEFKFCIPGHKITETVRLIRDEEVILTTVEKQVSEKVKSFVTTLTIKGKKNRYKNSGINPVDFPVMKIGKEAKGSTIHMESLVNILKKTQIAVDGNNLATALSGINLSSQENKLISMGATSQFAYKGIIDVNDVDINMIVPKSAINAIIALPISPEAKIGTDGKFIIVKSGSVQITAVLINGNYPKVENFFNSMNENKFIVINRQELIKSMRVLKLYSTKEDKTMVITVNAEDVVLTGEDIMGSSSAEEVIDIKNNNIEEGFQVALNPNFILSAITNCETDNVKIHLTSHKEFVFITEVAEEINSYWVLAPILLPTKKEEI